ncbi:hypothetical protein DS884_05140 [Tenacibaculum sp. E3R01]|nr:hypothetical protein DS884_05140 [Tenacibaculum sp. E3R01]
MLNYFNKTLKQLFMKKSILNLGKKLNITEQKEVNGGGKGLRLCSYHCNGTSWVLDGGQGSYCTLNFPSIIYNHPNCGGSGGGGDVWA